MGGVADVRYDWQWLNRLMAAISLIRGVGLALGSILAIAAALTVANVVRLALESRKDELEIMQLVGAPRVYVRGPFVMEGILQGGTGAVLALVGLLVGYTLIRVRYLEPLASTIDLASIRFVPLELCAAMVLGGMLVGCVGGVVATWRQ
jgi:cell division transport system permease protein